MRIYCAILNLNSKFIAISFYTMENENSSLTHYLGGGGGGGEGSKFRKVGNMILR